jgi:excisionase family DNA binding protein
VQFAGTHRIRARAARFLAWAFRLSLTSGFKSNSQLHNNLLSIVVVLHPLALTVRLVVAMEVLTPLTDTILGFASEPRIGRSVSLEHAAQLLGVSRRTIYNRIRDGRLRTVRTLGGSQRVLLDSVHLVRSQAAVGAARSSY